MRVNLPTLPSNQKQISIMEIVIHIEDSEVYDGGGNKMYYSHFTKSELIALRNAITNTLESYKELGWEDSDVRKRNIELEEEFKRSIKQRPAKEQSKKKTSRDYLYLIHDTVQNTLKIGISANPKNRFRNIQLATSNKLVMLYALKGKAHLERELHNEFAEIRLASEWFKYDERIIERYKNL